MYLLIKPASGACNLRCRYCFYQDEMAHRETAVRPLMTEETLTVLLTRTAEHLAKTNDHTLSIGFQGGEPTLAGLPFYRFAVAQTKALIPRGVRVSFSIQTNGTLLDDDFCAFLAENRFLVGLSLDGTREIHDRLRVDGAENGTHSAVLRALKLLRKHRCDFNVLTVVTAELARHPTQVYHYYKKLSLSHQQYIPCIPPFDGADAPHALDPEDYGKFLCTLFDLWYKDLTHGEAVSHREFENYVGILTGRYPEECGMIGRCALQYVIESDGSVYPCDFYALDDHLLGNVRTSSFAEMDEAREKLQFIERSIPLPDECMHCPYGILCRGGCYRHRNADGKHRLCTAYRIFFPYALPRLKQIADHVKRG